MVFANSYYSNYSNNYYSNNRIIAIREYKKTTLDIVSDNIKKHKLDYLCRVIQKKVAILMHHACNFDID